MIATKFPLVFLLVLFCSTVLFGQQRPNTKKLEVLFGKRVVGTDNIFEYNKDYAIELKFDATSGLLTGLEVAPKHFFQKSNADWMQEPRFDVGLSCSEYERIIDSVGRLVDLGKLKRIGSIAIVTNLKARFVDVYDNAIIERTQRSTSESDIYSAKVWLMRRVFGSIEEVARSETAPDFFVERVKIGDCWYWSKTESVKIGVKGRWMVAGPADTGCEGR